jgi:hypothetical protein
LTAAIKAVLIPRGRADELDVVADHSRPRAVQEVDHPSVNGARIWRLTVEHRQRPVVDRHQDDVLTRRLLPVDLEAQINALQLGDVQDTAASAPSAAPTATALTAPITSAAARTEPASVNAHPSPD